MEILQQTRDHETSTSLARRVRAQPRRCWRNAALAVSHLGSGAHYVEGWVVTDVPRPFVIEHGWCEVDGRIIDPTHAPQVSNDEPPAFYFAGMHFTVREAEAAVLRGRLPLAWSRETRQYWHAFEAAWRYATRLACPEPQPPTRVVHCRRESFDVFIGRPSTWASPYHIGPDGGRDAVIRKYCRWLARHPSLLRSVWTLQGKALGCRCTPMLCHGDVLADLADIEHKAVNGTSVLDRWLFDQRR